MAYNIDTSHSLIEFSVKHMMVTTVKGRFTKFQGDVEIDEQTPANSKVDVTIETASITTGDENRDGHLRSGDFFESEKYPTITFTSKTVEALGGEKYRVAGDLTMHGVTRPVSFDITREGVTKNMQGKSLQAFSANLTLSRKEFGLEWNVALESGGWLVSDQVKISLEVQALEAASVAA
ncbi:MAG TPA: YceI family protein [Ktedonobacterales bacterium]|nr:YceI family protein [Ktedonobacterales bacterium]